MLRPATPLTILFFIAFVLLLLSTLSTPVIRAIPLCRFDSPKGPVDLGVFGFCYGGNCTVKLGYSTGDILPALKNADSVHLPSGARHTLSTILIVHPVAALFTLVCTVLAAASHFRSPAHSPRYLLALFILCFPTLLITLLAFLVDILLFIPHLQWGGWIVLASTIIIVACTMLTCAMRRTLVSRKARKQRIAENAEMNGQNYYEQREEQQARDAFARAESPPPLDGNSISTGPEKLAQFATYDYDRPRASNEERIPLNAREPSVRSGSMDTARRDMNGMPRERLENGRPPVPAVSRGATVHGDPSSMSPAEQEERMRAMRRPSDPRSGYRTPPRGGPPPFYGRGRPGYPPPRGGYPPRGYPPPRGYRGGYPPRGGYGRPPRGPPPPGWAGEMGPMAGAMAGGAMMGGERRGPPPGYHNDYYGQGLPPRQDSYEQDYYGGSRSGSGRPSQERPRVPGGWPSSEDILDNYTDNVEMQDTSHAQYRQGEPNGSGSGSAYDSRRASNEYEYDDMSRTRDPASFGFSGRQPSMRDGGNAPRMQGSVPPVPPLAHDAHGHADADGYDDTVSPIGPDGGEHYGGTYISRSAWQDEPAGMSPDAAGPAPVELPAHTMGESPPRASSERTITRPRKASDAYYEDVEPRFSHDAGAEPADAQPLDHHGQPAPGLVPALLVPGYAAAPAPSPSPGAADDQRATSSLYSDEASDFTSISQRGVNPAWQGPAGPGSAGPQGQQSRDAILAANPDFELPGAGVGRSKGAASHVRGMSGSLRYPDA